MVTSSCSITVIDLGSGEVEFSQGSAIKCENGYLLLIGKVCFRSEACLTSSTACYDGRKILAEKLNACKLISEIIGILDDMIGGWAVIYYRKDCKKVLVGRDVFGRKSLLWNRIDKKFYFSIFVCDRQCSWYDLPPGTVTVLDLCNAENITIFYVFEISGPWIQQFNKLSRLQREAISERFMLSRELSFKNVGREDMPTILLKRLEEAVYRTVFKQDKSTKCMSLSFSGGVDSLLVAHLMARCMSQNVLLDLVNVAFGKGENYNEAPDRSQNDSIGCVQWFAARGEGFLFEDEEKPILSGKSEAKTIVVGSGADELFGGYMRHRTTYLKKGRNAVVEELSEELRRIGERNMGRDDRVVSSLGKDLKSPFLDDLFVEWVTSLPLEYKTDFTQPRGIGEKWLIREALKLLGTPQTLCLAPKRAMQFGSRIAKLESRGERGDDFCPRLLEE
ncbi:Asparagine synthetase domain-containing protein [Dirofilaria immitis]